MLTPGLGMDVPRHKPLVMVETTNNRGFTPDEIAQHCVNKIISVSDNAHPVIRDQARAFSSQIQKVLASHMQEAVRNDRITVYNALKDAGHPQLAELIRRL